MTITNLQPLVKILKVNGKTYVIKRLTLKCGQILILIKRLTLK